MGNQYIYIIVVLVIIVGATLWCNKNNSFQQDENYAWLRTLPSRQEDVAKYQIDNNEVYVGNNFALLGVPPEQPGFDIGFGMGGGLWGTAGSRATSTMIGN